MTILVCDDDREIAEAIAIYLRHEGYDAVLAHTGPEAVAAAREHDVQLIIMDVMMPGFDGLRATMRIRGGEEGSPGARSQSSNVPILMLSARSEDTDKVIGLNMGADDYLTKPFNPLELIARVKSLLRRYTQLGAQNTAPEVYRSGELELDEMSKTAAVDGEEVRLTPVEFGILSFLLKNAGRVFSIAQIYENVWDEPAFSPENTVAVHIRRIREKIEIDPKNPKYLKVVWGIGYKIEKL
ncbi:MAG: response regulator transcription factor [Oscillospiraceae bacterium]|jgi:DNA-binding response OmpR family regulator|nr:response regulator transcription factor [Oscillospiraceae bacterium]